MKIVFLEAVQEYGGAQMATLDIASRLSLQHDVMLVDCYGSCIPFVEAVCKKKVSLSIVLPRNEPYIISKYSSTVKNLFNALAYIPHWVKLRIRLTRMLSEIQPDFVVVYNTKVLSLLQSKNRGKYRSIYYAHGWYIPKQISLINKYLLKYRVDKILCISEATKQALYANSVSSLENLYVIHNSINEKKMPTDVAYIPHCTTAFKILHSGAFVPDKGIHISLEIAKKLKNIGLDFKLIVTGLVYHGAVSEQYYQEIKKRISEYELDDFVYIVRDKSNVINYFRFCDILIHPSATEGLPLVIMEAMVLKKPVIANGVGGVTDLIHHGFTGILPHYNDVNEYVDYILKFKTDRQFYDRIANNAYKIVQDTYGEEEQLYLLNRFFNKI